jgi:AcrR family transcriptional regulator
MRISELAEITGVTRYTIHYYLKEDLLPPPLKTGQTMALYSDVHVDCLRFIRELREKSELPIAAVRAEVRFRFGEEWRSPAASAALNKKRPRRSQKGERQRQRIIEIAVKLFSQKGYHRTHVSHVTDALHLSKGAFYQYFQNKEDLFVAVYDHLIRLLTQTEESIANEPDFLIRMSARGRAYFTLYEQYHKIFDIIRAESIGQEKNPGFSLERIYQKMLGPLMEDVKKAQEEGRIRGGKMDPEMRTFMLFGAFDFICYNIVKGRPYPVDMILDILNGIFLR